MNLRLEPKVKFKLTDRPVLHFGDGTLKMLLPFRLAVFFFFLNFLFALKRAVLSILPSLTGKHFFL